MNKQNIDSLDEDDLESGEGQEFVEDTEPKYLKVTFEDNKNNYTPQSCAVRIFKNYH